MRSPYEQFTAQQKTVICVDDFVEFGKSFAKFTGMVKTPIQITKPNGQTIESNGLLSIHHRWHINRPVQEIQISTLNGPLSVPAGTRITFVKPAGAKATRKPSSATR